MQSVAEEKENEIQTAEADTALEIKTEIKVEDETNAISVIGSDIDHNELGAKVKKESDSANKEADSSKKIKKCSHCDQTFRTNRGLYNHQYKVHHIKASFTCEQCGKQFKDSYKLNRHARIHMVQKKHVCEVGQLFSALFAKQIRISEQCATAADSRSTRPSTSLLARRKWDKTRCNVRCLAAACLKFLMSLVSDLQQGFRGRVQVEPAPRAALDRAQLPVQSVRQAVHDATLRAEARADAQHGTPLPVQRLRRILQVSQTRGRTVSTRCKLGVGKAD